MTGLTGSLSSIGVALVVCGAGYSIAKLSARAMDNMARQPEMGAKIQTVMIIAAALIEGIALFAAVICLVVR